MIFKLKEDKKKDEEVFNSSISPKKANIHLTTNVASSDYSTYNVGFGTKPMNKLWENERSNKFNNNIISDNLNGSSGEKVIQNQSPLKTKTFEGVGSKFDNDQLFNRAVLKKNTINMNVINHIIESSPIKDNEKSSPDKKVSNKVDKEDFGLGIVSRRKKNTEGENLAFQNTFYPYQGSNNSVVSNNKGSNEKIGIDKKLNELSYKPSNSIKQNKNFEKQIEDELKNINLQQTPSHSKNIFDVGNKEYESRRRKNQNNINSLVNTNFNVKNNHSLGKDDFQQNSNSLGIGNYNSNGPINASPRVKNTEIFSNSIKTTNPFNSKLTPFQPETNSTSIIGKDGSRRAGKNREFEK